MVNEDELLGLAVVGLTLGVAAKVIGNVIEPVKNGKDKAVNWFK